MTPRNDIPDDMRLACREHPGNWFDLFAWLEDREKAVRKADPANRIQCELFRIYAWCQDNKVPCNIIGLKSRKEGLSTGATALAYHHLSEHRAEAVVIGTDHETSDTLTSMVRRYAEHDQFPWGSEMKWKESENRGSWTHGSELKRDTAIDPKAGRSSTVQVLIATEVAHWPASGVRSADETMLSILNSMPDIPNLLRVVDSTANGSAGWFYQTYTGAVTFEERKRGSIGNGWIKVFEPWHSNPLRASPVTGPQELSAREHIGVTHYGWTPEQVQWRRETLALKCAGDEVKFDQEYPESEDVAFATSGSLRFAQGGILRLKEMADAHDKAWRVRAAIDPKYGILGELIEHADTRQATWLPSTEGWLWNIEGQHPIPGCRYIGFCDPATGAQAEGSKERDAASAGILRLAYLDETGPLPVQHNDELVCALHHEGGNHWDNDILAERLAVLLKMFRCPVIVEANNSGTEVIRLLLMAGCTVWRRQKRDHRNPGKLLDVVGFQTNAATKNLWIGALGQGIREETFDCRYPPAVKDFSTFILNEKGTGEAQAGTHDDWVTGCGLALFARNAATVYRPTAMPKVIDTGHGVIIVPDGQYQYGALA